MKRPDPDFASFAEFQPVLWRVLGALTRNGYYAQPDDAKDLLHDFYVDVWRALHLHFNASTGSFSSYACTAFYRFARRRIVELQHWHNRTVDVFSDIALPDSTPSVEESVDSHIRWRHLEHAAQALRTADRELLKAYLYEADGSERALARLRGVSRYQISMQLHSIFAELGERIDVARKTNMQSKNISSEPRQAPLVLLKRTLLSDRDESLLKEVKARANEIISALEGIDQELSEEERRQIEDDPQWLAEIYEAFSAADDEAVDEHTRMISEAIDTLHADEGSEIAAAFGFLLQSLPPSVTDWSSWFKRAGQIPDETRTRLRTQWSIRESDSADGLLAYGITPGTVFDATEGVSLLADRLMETGDGRSPVAVRFRERSCSAVSATYARFRAAMLATPGVPESAAEPLLAWLGEVARRRPYLFASYRVVGWSEEGFELVPDATYANAELMLRWSAFERPEFREQRYALGA